MRQQPNPSIQGPMSGQVSDRGRELQWNPLMMKPSDERWHRATFQDELDHQGLDIMLPREDQARAARQVD